MQVRFCAEVVEETISVEISADGLMVQTLLLPKFDNFEEYDETLEVAYGKITFGSVSGMVLPEGYFAFAMFVDGQLKQIFLAGPGLSRTVDSQRAVYEVIDINERRLARDVEAGQGKTLGM